ncbi:MAG: hypothetical protein GWP03_02425 [Proteobacteria bacterium]|nr:hypothetical protein [Pseudomonadota bacterium]
MVALLIIIAIFIVGFIALVFIYNSKTNSFSKRHREEHLRDLDNQLKEGKISKEDYIELRKKL